MTDGIIIATAPGREQWALDCSASIKRDHVIVSLTDGYELGKLRWCLDQTSWDRFIFLQDSTVVYNDEMFDLIAKHDGSICLNHTERHFSCYLGVYERRVLNMIGVPRTMTKKESILCETNWTEEYDRVSGEMNSALLCLGTVLEPYKWHEVERHGRTNVVYSTPFLTKWQAQWGQTPIDELDLVV